MPEEWRGLWGGSVFLHNRPFYSIENIEDEERPASPIREMRVVKSLYDLNKSAADWGFHDFTEA